MLKFTFQQQILAGFFSFLLCGFVLTFTSYQAINSLQGDEAGLAKSRKALLKLNKVQVLISDCEIGVKSFLLTDNEVFLKPYYAAHASLKSSINELRDAVAYNKESVSYMDSLEHYATAKIEGLDAMAKATHTLSLNDETQLALEAKGNQISKRLEGLIRKVTESQDKLLIQGEEIELALNHRSTFILFSLLAFEIAIMVFLIKFITGAFKKQKQIEQKVLQANEDLKTISEQNAAQNWVLTGLSHLDKTMRGVSDVNILASKIITELAKHVEARVATLYIKDEKSRELKLTASYAYKERKHNNNSIREGEGLIGQAVLEKQAIVFNNVPPGYINISSGIGESAPHSILIQPFLFEDEVKGVIELGFSEPTNEVKKEFIEKVMDAIAVAFNTAQSRIQIHELLEATQQQAEELETQQEELRTTNEELITKTINLQTSEEELRIQQDELRLSNTALEEKARELEERNRVIDEAKEVMSLKAQELEIAGKYKSEFLANMSHELRTPLNSILILARILKENRKANLEPEQIKYASVIHNSGNDLLTLINDILDLSKIESGKIDLEVEQLQLTEITRDMEYLFKEVANTKFINYTINIGTEDLQTIYSDRVRLQQILKNLLSNAFKFTPNDGSVSLDISFPEAGKTFGNEKLSALTSEKIIAFSVKDTGIGIPKDKQDLIFEAFQQADGSTSRKYGGTGLGLSISRELANLLGGEIQISSIPGEGSTFTLYVPVVLQYVNANGDLEKPTVNEPVAPVNPIKRNPEPIKSKAEENKAAKVDNQIHPTQNDSKETSGEHTMLIVEDDQNFANILEDYAKERGFKPVLAETGEDGLRIAMEIIPDSIILDIMLPGMDGWNILRKLKSNHETKDIPVHMMSAGEGGLAKARTEGATGFLKKPVAKDDLATLFNLLSSRTTPFNKVLIVEDNEIQSDNLRNQLTQHGVEVIQTYQGEEALEVLRKHSDFDCIILDVNLPDISGIDLLDKIKTQKEWSEIPVIINTAMELDKERMTRVMKHTHAMVLKMTRPNDRLIDEVNLFMNKVKNNGNQTTIAGTSASKSNHSLSTEKALSRKSVLLVDDDMRNIFALSSALEVYDMNIEIAVNGIDALKKLDDRPDTDIVLMDIMMPEMDGFEAIREIRKQKRFNKLPILSLTAKAMKNDREKCIEAGANDYISKPVDMDKLVSMLRVWLS